MDGVVPGRGRPGEVGGATRGGEGVGVPELYYNPIPDCHGHIHRPGAAGRVGAVGRGGAGEDPLKSIGGNYFSTTGCAWPLSDNYLSVPRWSVQV